MPTPSLGVGADLNDCLPFSLSSAWNHDVSSSPLRSDSSSLICRIGSSAGLHPDFGSGTYGGSSIGTPYVVIPETQPLAPITFNPYPGECDLGTPPGFYPIPMDAPIEGLGGPAGGDRHVIVAQAKASSPNGLGNLYELFQAFPQGNYPSATTGWTAFGCIFDMAGGDMQRPQGWTSADAAGLPIFPGLVKYDEVRRASLVDGHVNHAFRFTIDPAYTALLHVPPAENEAGVGSGPVPFGMRVRLKASWVPPPGSTPLLMAIVRTLKKYGMIMADNGANWFLAGSPDARWDNAEMHWLTKITGHDFEIIDTGAPTP
jgi:hypothetical protein